MRLSKEIKDIASRWRGRWYALQISNGEINFHYRQNGEKEAVFMRRDNKLVIWSIHDQRNIREYKTLKEFARDLARWVDREPDETGLIIFD
jgi:hypothetical protein